jgi:hypothetical protein
VNCDVSGKERRLPFEGKKIPAHMTRANVFLFAGKACNKLPAARLPGKAAGQDCRARLPGKAAGQGCRARLPGKAAGQSYKSHNKSPMKNSRQLL